MSAQATDGGAPLGAPSVSDALLLDAARTGDEHAFGALLERHRRGVEQVCCLMLGDRERGEQALRDAALTAWRERDVACGCPSVRIWLHRIAIRECLEALGLPAMSFGPGDRLTQ